MCTFKDLTGQRFGRFVALEPVRVPKRPVHWKCICDCGAERIVDGSRLRLGRTKSCGCFLKDVMSARTMTHGHKANDSYTPEYTAWANIKARCYDPNQAAYPRYGGRGIRMSQPWIDSFERFLADVGYRPSLEHSIDRYPNACDMDGMHKGLF